MATLKQLSLCVSLWSATLAPIATAAAPLEQNSLDVDYGSALYEYYQGNYFTALNQLHIAELRGAIKGHGDNPQLSEAGISLAYGMEEHAQKIFTQLLDGNRPPAVRNAAWFYLARLQYSRGNWSAAQASLESLTPPFDADINDELQALRINVAIRLDQLEVAESALAELPAESPWQNYLRFNLGAAFSRQGDYASSVSYYDTVSHGFVPASITDRSEYLALYDKALTAAGYSLMLDDQPVEAIKRFVRVRRDSPWSDRALLGYGWSALDSKNFRLALQPWQLLVQGPIALSSTQEAMLALPYVYEQLDAKGAALAEWQLAEGRFSDQLLKLDETLEHLQSLSMVDAFALGHSNKDSHWLASAETYPIPESLDSLQEVLSSHAVRDKMQRLRDLSLLQQSLGQWQNKIALYKDLVDDRSSRRTEKRDVLQSFELASREQSMLLEQGEYAKTLSRIENEKDYLALAVGETRELNEIVTRLGKTLDALEAAGQDISAEREAYQRYRGILLWQASETYSEQLWQGKKRLRALGNAIESFSQRRDSISKVLTDAVDIQPWHGRLDNGAQRITAHRENVQELIAQEEQGLRDLLLAALSQQRQALKSYLSQTRLAIARLLDAALREQKQ